jgi:hypothetical protein
MTTEIKLSDLTEVKLDGAGAFDTLMRAAKIHLEDQYGKGTIRGPEYATVYLGQLESSMQNALAFVTTKQRITLELMLLEKQIALADVEVLKANAQLQILQEQALTAVIERDLVSAQVDKVRAEIELTNAQRANIIYEQHLLEANAAKVNAEILNVPKQGAQIDAQTILIGKQSAQVEAETLNVPKQGLMIDAQTAVQTQQKLNLIAEATNLGKQGTQIDAQTALITSNKAKTDAETLLVPKQGELLDKQVLTATQQVINAEVEKRLLEANVCKAQAEFDYTQQNTLKSAAELTLLNQKTATEKAQVLSLGVDSDSVIGRQKGLYAAQTAGFQRDGEQKAASLYIDVWKTLRMTDNEWQANLTQGLDDATMGLVLSKLRAGINVVAP